MSTNISGRGKQRKHGHDLNTNSMSMGGGQTAMPPNGAAAAPFGLPIVPVNHAPPNQQDYAPRQQYGGSNLDYSAASGHQHVPSMALPNGTNIQQTETSPYAMHGPPQPNMQQRPGMQQQQQQPWMTQQQQQQHQQQQMMQHGGVANNRVLAPQPTNPRSYQQQPQPMVPYPVAYSGGQPGFAYMGNLYPGQVYPQEYGYMVAPQPQQFYQPTHHPMMAQQQQQQQHQQQMQAVPPPQSQQAGGATGGVGAGGQMSGVPTSQPTPMHGGAQSGAPIHQGTAPATAPAVAPVPSYNPTMQQPRPSAPPAVPKQKKILAIVNPETKETMNQKDVEASLREEDAPKAEKEEAKGTDETDSAAPEVKKQFANAILEQTTKSEKPAPAPASAPPPKPVNKCLFSPDQLVGLKISLKDKASQVPAHPVVVPPAPVAAPVAAAPAAEQPVSEEEAPVKQSTPEVVPTEMPATSNDEQADESQLAEVSVHEEPASSSSEKNASNDSAICVQSPVAQPTPVEEEKVVVVEEPTPVAADEAAVEDVVQEREEKEEEEADQPADVEEPLVKKLEQLVIEESVSQEEAESEPSTPAPVTPSVSETAANLAEEEEDAEKAEEERLQKMEEERQKRRADLEAAIAQNMEDIDQVNEEIGRYNREYLYNVRDLEKYFHVTPCPLTPDELKNFGICRSLVSNEPRKKQDGQGGFMPGWARSGGGGGRGGGPKPYTGRQSEQHQRGGGGRHGSNKKLPPSIRPSIERRVETNVQLHKAEKAWKPEKVTDAADLEDEEVKKKLLLKTIRALFNKITPTTKEALINEFLDHKVYQSPALNEVISVIFDKAVEEPKFCPLYSNMCNTQVAEELKLNNNVSLFRNAILVRAQETFTTKNLDDYVAEKQAEIEAETDEKKKKEKQIELLETQSKFRRRKFGNITFIGQLYLQGLISIRIIHFCVVDLLKSVAKTAEPVEPDEESIDCAVRLLETIGKRLHEESVRANKEAANAAAAAKNAPKVIQRGAPVPKPQSAPTQQFPLELTFQTLEGATSNVSSRIKFMIMNLVELRRNGWVPRKGADAGPKKLDEIKKDIQKEQMENQHQQQMYERKQSRQEPMGGRGMGGGGGHGGHGGNPKRQVIQRNSTDRGNIEERRAQAYKSSNLPPSKAPAKKASLSTVTATEKTSLGGGAKKWSHGASGGSENSKKEERAGAIQQTSRFMQQRSSSAASMKEDEGAGASGNATQVNSEDEREANELREKQEADIAKRVVCDVGDYGTGEITLEEVREEVFKIVGQEKFGSPSLQLVFKCFMTAAVKKVTTASETGPKFGHVLAFCLLKKADEKDTKSRDEMLKGVADSCREVVEQEQWEDAPKIWDIFAEVLINAHVAEEGLFEGAHPTLNDFKDAFLHAAKDTRKPYTLFVLVLKRLAEFHHKRDKDAVMEVMSWVLDECETIVKKMDKKKLDKALEDTTTNFDGNLHKIMNENRH